MRKLQVLQNKVLRLQTRMTYGTPTNTLLAKANNLSVHPLIAYYSMTQVYKVISTKQPYHHFKRLITEYNEGPGTRSLHDKRIEFNLSIGRGSFFYQASSLWAALPENVKACNKIATFKTANRNWTRNNILVKPLIYFCWKSL